MTTFQNVPTPDGITSQKTAQDIISSGQALIQTKSQYQCAISVQKPRNLIKIRNDVLNEARLAKDEFFYLWQVKSRKDNKIHWIEGGTIGLAQSLFVNYTNCVIIPKYTEKNGCWLFETTFIDFEKGITLSRHLIHYIPQAQLGKHSLDRTKNMAFQLAQSKNIRDTIFLGIHRWLRNEAIEEAKKASEDDVEKNREVILTKAMNYFETQGIKEKHLSAYLGKKDGSKFNNKDIVFMRNLVTQLRNGEITVESIIEYSNTGFEEQSYSYTKKHTGNNSSEQKPPQKSRTTFKDLTSYELAHFNNIKTEESMNKFLMICPREKIKTFSNAIQIKIKNKYREITGNDLFETSPPPPKQNDIFFATEFQRLTKFALIYFRNTTKSQLEGFMRMNPPDKIKNFPGPIIHEITKRHEAVYGKPLVLEEDFLSEESSKIGTLKTLTELQQQVSDALSIFGQDAIDQIFDDCKIPHMLPHELSDNQCNDILAMCHVKADQPQ